MSTVAAAVGRVGDRVIVDVDFITVSSPLRVVVTSTMLVMVDISVE
jgi:hypothetical protein